MKVIGPVLLTESTSSERGDDCACADTPFLLVCDIDSEFVEADCACPDKAFQLTVVPPSSPQSYLAASDVYVEPLVGDFHLMFSPYAPAGASVLNEAAYARWRQFEAALPLSQEIDQKLVEQALIAPVQTRLRWQASQAETVTAWLHVTNACNLDCPYCYVRKSSARMSLETGLEAVRHIVTTAVSNQFRRVKLKYAGGEASLHFKLIKQLHTEALKLTQAQDLDLREVVLSNGVHIRTEDADWLVDNRVKLMVSLDGVGEMHDQQRPFRNGRSSFTHIEHTMDEVLLPRGIKPDISITITRLNAGGVAEAVRWALERDLPVSLNFYRENSQSRSREDLQLEEDIIIKGMLKAYQVFEEVLPERPFFNGLLDRVQGEAHAHTCGVQHSYLVINHQGALAQCQMHLDAPTSTTLSDNLILQTASGPIQNISVDEKEGCRTCEFRYRCTGGCPLETYRATGRWDVKSPHCRIYKTLMPQAMRLEGLRLLKTHGYLH
jgi:uncharacterized protein